MTIYELLFILLFLAATVTLLYAAIATVRGSRRQGVRILGRLAFCAAAYFAAVVIVAATSTRKVVQIGEPQCFDDWCITVVAVSKPVAHADSAWHVWLRVSSRAKRVTQRELNAVVYLTDDRNRRFDPLRDPSAVPLDTPVGPGESVSAMRSFAVPEDARRVGLVFTHEGGFPIGALIVGENQWFHKAPVVRLE